MSKLFSRDACCVENLVVYEFIRKRFHDSRIQRCLPVGQKLIVGYVEEETSAYKLH